MTTAAASAIRSSAGTCHVVDGCRIVISAVASSPLAIAARAGVVGRTSASSAVAITPHANSGTVARNAAIAAARPTSCGSFGVEGGGPRR